MVHPLYHQCRQCINQPVTIHLLNGKSHYGLLSQVTYNGLYLTPVNNYASVPKSDSMLPIETADQGKERNAPKAEKAFWPFFFPFAALAGFTLGFAAGAIATRPFYW
ncbi:hypothetical protein LSG31_13150 [Fodinisporobacter ferrooxydans]|uniref:Uncharacterized protein n=1 Tax=Fodinisporobacter ferrooxydans TaxID=2901836 RepID=A0ABY4CEE2_9BACL|nr:hypothetical protein LSG31_13150 [Alicyclobacillaceae bacterium MYW30-H2]